MDFCIFVQYYISYKMKIGDLDLGEKPLFLAHMEDVTDASFGYI